MKFINVALDIEEIQKLESEINNTDLVEFIENYKKGFDNILSTMALPILVMYDSIKKNYELKYRMNASLHLKRSLNDSTDVMLNEINRLRSIDFDQKKIFKEVVDELNKIPEKYKFINNSINTISLYTLVSSWTIFESIMKDLWIHLLNTRPSSFYNILESNSTNESIEGIEGKNISIKLLFKYNLDISSKLGDILHSKYDFTSVYGIKKAYSEIFKNKNIDLSFLDDKYLKQLEIARNNIVHKAGYIDEKYSQRTMFKNEKIGSVISYSASRMNKLHNSAIYNGISLFKCVDKIISE
jgi:hypothetical protein